MLTPDVLNREIAAQKAARRCYEKSPTVISHVVFLHDRQRDGFELSQFLDYSCAAAPDGSGTQQLLARFTTANVLLRGSHLALLGVLLERHQLISVTSVDDPPPAGSLEPWVAAVEISRIEPNTNLNA